MTRHGTEQKRPASRESAASGPFGVGLSLAANLAQAQPTAWGRVVAAVRSGAFLVAVSMIERRPARRAADEDGGAGRRWLDRTGTGLSGCPRTTSRAAWVHGIGAQNVGSGTASGGHADDQISVHIGSRVLTVTSGCDTALQVLRARAT